MLAANVVYDREIWDPLVETIKGLSGSSTLVVIASDGYVRPTAHSEQARASAVCEAVRAWACARLRRTVWVQQCVRERGR